MLLHHYSFKIYDIFHPFILLFFLYLNFNSLLIHTVKTLIGSLFIPVFLLQILRFVVIVNLKKAHVLYVCFIDKFVFLSYLKVCLCNQKICLIFKNMTIVCLYFVFSCILVHIFIVFYGALVINYLLETILCALHLTVLGILPMICIFGVDRRKYMELVSLELDLENFENLKLSVGFFGTFVGSWLGAIPIPLDWNKGWQKWPIPIVIGGYLGYSLSIFIIFLVYVKKSIFFKKED
ncbi:hypothetical protein PNEG_02315 [Pneumocystis murina B123]|uniref:Glycosylphosphatidylinositol anchor biosynthesis protein 11 n=1 Tax=Pneumocystis murina (strain B123) TaxID=1069680 RepID=M7P684_PNEMU|nr:hypothetical protein PNEG_02315 [Pneumocystis murina B123]EMR09365.1 hypothetical protein PNEG_02315 [Pneumocystis murina B123]